MALRLAGDPFLAIQGADKQGWVREITAQDALPGLKINQQGTGRVFDFQDGGVSKLYLPDGGNVTIAGSLVFDLANDVTITLTNPAAPRTLTIPAVGGNRTFVFLEEEQTFTAAHIFTTVQGTDTTDATSTTAAAMKTAGGLAVAKKGFFGDLVDITKSGSPYTKAHLGANGPHVARMVGRKNEIVDNTLTSFLQVTVPHDHLGGIIKLDYIVNTNQIQRWRMGGLFISIARRTGIATAKSLIAYIPEQTLLPDPGAGETTTVTFTLSANSGATGATQTFDVQVTCDSNTDQNAYIHYVAELLSARSDSNSTSEITIASV